MSWARIFEMRRSLAVIFLLVATAVYGQPPRHARADDLLLATPDQVDLGFVPLTELSVNILPKTRDAQGRALMMAPDRATEFFAANGQDVMPIDQVRLWGLLEYQWEAPAFCYDPLYFEEVNAERYGNTFGCWQPWVSAGHFYATVGLLPLKMLIEPPHDCEYYLGHYRPGRCVPFEWHCRTIWTFSECCP